MCDRTLDYFSLIPQRDAAAVTWTHAANSCSRLTHALTGELMTGEVMMRKGVQLLHMSSLWHL